jgi:1,4-alpha-glucan branching enzyme
MKLGELGSPYAVRDYYGIHEPYGNKDDLKALIAEVHSRNMKIILDWVPNHTAWDNDLIYKHTEYYAHDSLGNIRMAYDWKDIAQLDYSKKEVRSYMIEAMKYWVKEFDIDGFRCDVAWGVPTDFWEVANAELKKLKPLFMLAEAEGPEYHRSGFDMTYTWQFMDLRTAMMDKKKNVWDLDTLIQATQKKHQKQDIQMYFTTNHDEDGNGTSFERLKGAAKAYAVFTFTVPGMPLIYTGQETANTFKADFMKKEYVVFQDHDMEDFYTYLISLKDKNPALWNGKYGGDYQRISNGSDSNVISFLRLNGENKVLAIINLSDSVQTIKIESDELTGKFTDLFKSEFIIKNLNGKHFVLEPFEYRLFSSN